MPRLKDAGPNVVDLIPEVEVLDEYGTPVRLPDPDRAVRFTAHLQRVSAREAQAIGQNADTIVRVITSRRVPGRAWSEARVDGRLAEVLGEPVYVGRSPRTAHTTLVVRFLNHPIAPLTTAVEEVP